MSHWISQTNDMSLSVSQLATSTFNSTDSVKIIKCGLPLKNKRKNLWLTKLWFKYEEQKIKIIKKINRNISCKESLS